MQQISDYLNNRLDLLSVHFQMFISMHLCHVTDMNRATEIFLCFVYASSLVKIFFIIYL
jgi:hypothetical protein